MFFSHSVTGKTPSITTYFLFQHGLFTTIHKYYKVEEWQKFAEENPTIIPNVAVTAGMNPEDFERLSAVLIGVPSISYICLDVANGYSQHFVEYVRKVRSAFPTHTIIVSCVRTNREFVKKKVLGWERGDRRNGGGADTLRGRHNQGGDRSWFSLHDPDENRVWVSTAVGHFGVCGRCARVARAYYFSKLFKKTRMLSHTFDCPPNPTQKQRRTMHVFDNLT